MGVGMNVAYGPPGDSGVKTLMHVGAEDETNQVQASQIHRVSGTVGLVSVGVWAFASIAGNEQLRRAAFATSLAAFLARLATRPR